MIKIGLIFCAYNNIDTINQCLKPWAEAKHSIENVEFIYSCISVPFQAYQEMYIIEDATIDKVKDSGIMDVHFTEPKYIQETEARGMCLDYLINRECDWIMQFDGDELITLDQIRHITNALLNSNGKFAWYRLSYKNYINDDKHYLNELFCPARIFKVKFPPFTLDSFKDDNDCCYKYGAGLISNLSLKSTTINLGIKHLTWLDNNRSKNKIEYQKNRGWQCSYKWDQELGKVEIDNEYYIRKNLPTPTILLDSN